MPDYKAPRGTLDVLPFDTAKWQYVESQFRKICKNYGFSEIRTPTFEHTELFTRNLGESTDVVSKEMYTFQTKGDKSLTLRPEGTAPTMRAFVEHNLDSRLPFTKLYYIARLFRYERPQAGRYREHTQLGIECVGISSPEIDAEIISLAINFIESIGIKEYELKINSIGCPECRPKYKEALMEYSKNYFEELCPTCKIRFETNPLRMLDCKEEGCRKIFANAPSLKDNLGEECSAHFAKVRAGLDRLGIKYKVDNNLVRGFDYYTKTAFEITPKTGLGSQDAIGGGGRYDNLISELGHTQIPSIGFGMGLERLILTLNALEIELPIDKSPDCYIVAAGDQAQEISLELANDLRKIGIKTETDFTRRSIKAQMKTAGKLCAKYAIILGDNEIESQTATIKSMADSNQEQVAFADMKEYLKINLV